MLKSSGPASDFEREPRRKQELRGRPIANRIYRRVFGDGVEVERFDRGDEFILDKEFATDVQVRFPSGLILLGQEKFLSHKYARFNSVTVEYEQDAQTGERGDWFNLGVQFYFVGYFSPDNRCFKPWILLDWTAAVLATHQGRLTWQANRNQNGRARASFRWCDIGQIPPDCTIARS